jgi:molybdenum cofactor cytidylyltransferase
MPSMTPAIIPAAGHSRRMGRTKLALPLGDGTVLEHVVAALRTGGACPILIVIGPHVADLAPLAERAGGTVLQLAEETPEMRATVEQGLGWIEEHCTPAPADDWLLVPADHPALDAGVVRQLLAVRAQFPQHSILIPTFQGRRGHPTLIAWKIVPALRALPTGQGLNAYFRQHQSEVAEVPVETASILVDLDTPEDYERLLCEHALRQPTFRLFVYGTLKRGGGYHEHLAGQRFLREATTAPGFVLLDLGPYPALVRRSDGGRVHGELFEVDTRLLPQLNWLEDAPKTYRLERIVLAGEESPVFTYVYQLDEPGAPTCPNGRWQFKIE